MATITKWTPFGVALDITATGGTVTRTSATKFTVKINASWETYYSGAQTKYGMIASSGGSSVTLKTFNNTAASSGSGSFTGTYSISGNGAATKSIVVTFRNFNDDNGDSATKNVTFSVSVPAWTSYTVTYSANGGTGAPSSQTKWKDQTLTISGTKPTRTGYSFLGWSTSSTATSATYSAGGSYTNNGSTTLYAVWKANTYTVRYNANGGSGAPGNQTKTYGQTLTLSSAKPTRTNYTFKGWSTTASATTATYSAGGSYTANAAATLYAVWELSYVKPQITNLSASRCNSNGTASDSGTYALIKFKWTATIAKPTITVVCANTSGTTVGTYNITSSGTSGTVSQVVGNGSFNVETSYTFTVTVADTNDSTNRVVTMSGTEFHMDFSKNSVAIGKPAETLVGTDGVMFKAFDVKWRSKFRECVCVGDKMYYQDGNQGVFLSWEGFMHLQRTTAQGYHPYIGFYLDDATSAAGTIRLNCNTKLLEFLNAAGYHFGGDLIMDNNDAIMGHDSNGTAYNVFQAKNESNNTVVGYDNYANASGNTNIYGYDINFGVANISNPGTYRPYRRKGDTLSLTLRTSGYVTNGCKDVSFWIPFAEPIVGSPAVTVASGNGFIFRQGDKYTHGSTASVYAKPVSYEATATMLNGVYVKAVFSDISNATNNDSIGIYWNGTVTFS
jgi:uncharacterized repeat protein (TIGR02543 family)